MTSRLDNSRAMRRRLDASQHVARRNVLDAVDTMAASEIADVTPLFNDWAPGEAYAVQAVVAHAGLLYSCAQAHTSQVGWEPSAAPALWSRMGLTTDNPDAVPQWVQPSGAQDAYKVGDKVMHGGKMWISAADNNVWEPGAAGVTQWSEVQEEVQ